MAEFKGIYESVSVNEGNKCKYPTRLIGYKEISVCNHESEAYAYWKETVNHNPDDCCDLRKEGGSYG